MTQIRDCIYPSDFARAVENGNVFFKFTYSLHHKSMSELKPAERAILYTLLTLAPFEGSQIRIGVRSLARELGYNPSTVSRGLKRLEALGMIELEIRQAQVIVLAKTTTSSADLHKLDRMMLDPILPNEQATPLTEPTFDHTTQLRTDPGSLSTGISSLYKEFKDLSLPLTPSHEGGQKREKGALNSPERTHVLSVEERPQSPPPSLKENPKRREKAKGFDLGQPYLEARKDLSQSLDKREKYEWEAEVGDPYPGFVEWLATTFYEPQGGGRATRARSLAAAEIDNKGHKAKWLWMDYLASLDRAADNGLARQAYGDDPAAYLPSYMRSRHQPTKEEVAGKLEQMMIGGIDAEAPNDTEPRTGRPAGDGLPSQGQLISSGDAFVDCRPAAEQPLADSDCAPLPNGNICSSSLGVDGVDAEESTKKPSVFTGDSSVSTGNGGESCNNHYISGSWGSDSNSTSCVSPVVEVPSSSSNIVRDSYLSAFTAVGELEEEDYHQHLGQPDSKDFLDPTQEVLEDGSNSSIDTLRDRNTDRDDSGIALRNSPSADPDTGIAETFGTRLESGVETQVIIPSGTGFAPVSVSVLKVKLPRNRNDQANIADLQADIADLTIGAGADSKSAGADSKSADSIRSALSGTGLAPVAPPKKSRQVSTPVPVNNAPKHLEMANPGAYTIHTAPDDYDPNPAMQGHASVSQVVAEIARKKSSVASKRLFSYGGYESALAAEQALQHAKEEAKRLIANSIQEDEEHAKRTQT